MKKGYTISLVLVSLFFLTSCASWNPLYKNYLRKTEVTNQISALNAQHVADLAEQAKKINQQYELIIANLTNQLQGGANSLYGAAEGFKFYPKPSRLDIIINNRVTEAQAAIGIPPTYEAIVKENKRLQEELDETKTSMEQLTKTHQATVAENAKLSDATVKSQKDLADLKQAMLQMEQNYIKQNSDLQTRLNGINDNLIESERKRADLQASIERLKRQLMLWCGIGAVLALIGAIYSPVFKEGLAILAGALGAATIAIPFIEGWMVALGLLIIVAGVVIYMILKHRVAEKANTNIINAVEDTKQSGTPIVPTLKSNLKTWNTNYAKDKLGNIITVADKSVEKYINQKLMQSGRLDPKATPTLTPVVVVPVPTPLPVLTPTPTDKL